MQPFLASAIVTDPQSDATITRRILDLLDEAHATATFFVTTRFLERYPDVVREIHAKGHEIGTHGPKHLRLQQQNPEGFQKDIRAQKQLLLGLVGVQPIGYRAPHFSLTEKTRWILPILLEEGYQYDSSLFAASSLEYGSGSAPNEPHAIQTASGPILEIPVPGLPAFGFRIPFAGGVYFRLIPAKIYAQMLAWTGQKTIGMLYLHPHELNPDTPKIQRGPWLKRFFKYYGTTYGKKRLKYLVDCFSFRSIQDTLSAK